MRVEGGGVVARVAMDVAAGGSRLGIIGARRCACRECIMQSAVAWSPGPNDPHRTQLHATSSAHRIHADASQRLRIAVHDKQGGERASIHGATIATSGSGAAGHKPASPTHADAATATPRPQHRRVAAPAAPPSRAAPSSPVNRERQAPANCCWRPKAPRPPPPHPNPPHTRDSVSHGWAACARQPPAPPLPQKLRCRRPTQRRCCALMRRPSWRPSGAWRPPSSSGSKTPMRPCGLPPGA